MISNLEIPNDASIIIFWVWLMDLKLIMSEATIYLIISVFYEPERTITTHFPSHFVSRVQSKSIICTHIGRIDGAKTGNTKILWNRKAKFSDIWIVGIWKQWLPWTMLQNCEFLQRNIHKMFGTLHQCKRSIMFQEPASMDRHNFNKAYDICLESYEICLDWWATVEFGKQYPISPGRSSQSGCNSRIVI